MMDADTGSLNVAADEDSNIIHVIGGGTTSVPGLAPAVLGGRSRRSGNNTRGWASSGLDTNKRNGESKIATVISVDSQSAPSVASVESPPPRSPRAGQSSQIVLPPPAGRALRTFLVGGPWQRLRLVPARPTSQEQCRKKKRKTREQIEQERQEREEEEPTKGSV